MTPPTRRRSTPIAGAAIALVTSIVWLAAALPAAAAHPTVTLTIKASPNPAATGAPITFTGTVAPSSGTPTNVRVHMESTATFSDGACEPAAYCEISSFQPTWTFPTLVSKTTITFATVAKPGTTVRLYLDSDGVGCTGTCPPSVTLIYPTVTPSFSWTADDQIVAGTTLHVTARASTNAGPINGNLHVDLPTGVDAPTNLSPGALYSGPPSHYIDDGLSLVPSAEYSFDVMVNAADGTTLTFQSWFFEDTGPVSKMGSLSIKVGPDSGLPTTTSPRRSLVAGALSAGMIPVRLHWTGTDGQSGVDHYDLSQRTDSGSWSTVATGLPTASTTRLLLAGHDYRFRVRAIDHAGNTGAWTAGATFALASQSETSASIHYAGSWTLRSDPMYRGGHAKVTSTAGRTVSRTFTGTSIGWLARKAPSQGKAKIYVNGSLEATIDLYAPSSQPQRLVWTGNWSAAAKRTVVILALGTSGRPTVNLDGLIIIR